MHDSCLMPRLATRWAPLVRGACVRAVVFRRETVAARAGAPAALGAAGPARVASPLLPLYLVCTCLVATCAISPGCGRASAEPAVQIVGESTRLRITDPAPASSPWFDGARVSLTAARGEILGLQVLHRGGGAVVLGFAGRAPAVQVRGYAVEVLNVRRPSTDMYGGSHGPGRYADGLVPAAAPTTDPAYFEIEIARDAPPGAVVR